MKVLGFLSEDAIEIDLKATSKEGAIRELVRMVIKSGDIGEAHEDSVLEGILEREMRGSTGLGDGIAIPHLRECPHVTGLTGAFARSVDGIPFDAVDGQSVHLMFLIVGGEGTNDDHIATLRKLAALRMNEHFLRFLRQAKDLIEVTDIIKEMTDSVA